jgi:protein-S-isoprenylcysteine O-methyltransferase Ste14
LLVARTPPRVGRIVPTFAWRAYAEETVLGRAFGERYAEYRKRTRMIIPDLL